MGQMNEFFAECLGFQDPKLVELLGEYAVMEHIKRGSHVVEIGKQMQSVMLLVSGIFRGYLVDEKGCEMTDCFAFQRGDAIIGCNRFEDPSNIEFEALTDCVVISLPMAVIKEALGKFHEMSLFYNECLLEALDRHWRIKRVMYRPAIDRYRWFLQDYPGLINLVSHKLIATFLGITPVTLSRLRHQDRDAVGSPHTT